jgi:hypothetical protein
MSEMKTMGLQLPVQAVVDRTATGGTLNEGVGVDASQNFAGAPMPGRAPVGTLPPSVLHVTQGPCIRSFGRWLC